MRVMMLGAGPCQADAIRRIETEMGHEVVAADYYRDAPGKSFSTFSSEASTFDGPACLETAKRYGVDGVMTTGTDQPVYTAAYVSEELGLEYFFDSNKALDVTDKKRMKTIMERAGIPTVPHAFIAEDFTDGEISALEPPYVIKPLDSQGQRGVYRLESIEDIRAHIGRTLSYSRKSEVLIENFYENDEITISGWVVDGEAKILTVTDRIVMERDVHIGICTAHQFPSKHMNTHEKEIRSLTDSITRAFGIMNGPVYYQFLVGAEGIKVNEIACRIGGAYEDMFIPELTGVDPLKMQVDFILGKTVSYGRLLRHDAWSISEHMSAQLFFADSGEIAYMTPLEKILETEGTFKAGYHFREGDVIGDIVNATQRAGYFIVKAEDGKRLKDRVGTVYGKLEILGVDGKNLVRKGPVL